MKKITALILLSFLTSVALRADLIYQETFNYSNGPVSITSTNGTGSTTVSNWLTHSGNLDSYVNNHRLEVSTTTAYLGVTATRSGDVHRNLSVTNNSIYTNVQQVLYASFIVNFTNLPMTNGAYFAHFYVNSSTFPSRIWALQGNPGQTTNNFAALPGTFRIGVQAGTAPLPNKVFPIDLALNTDYQIVIGYNPTSGNPNFPNEDDSVTLWVNPISSSDVSVVTGDAFVPGANIANSFAFRQASGFGGFLTVSNLVVATTFAEAATNVLSTNAVPPKIVYQPLGITNFVGATVTLSAVAVGQSLGNLTYQWFDGVNPYSNPAGNTNVLSIANAQTTDSGNYTLVVTTPFGLSVTSSVAKVLISAVPVPPSFVTQPVSKTLYVGQNMVLTTSVSSPGNVTFTWYSNNVVVTAGQTDNGDSSTYEIDNVTTDNSATYKVAVTNDVVVNGVVSSNAVVTVLNPPAVSIAYLRTLVDPNNNYQATNSTQPYQVTGIVTTYTNLTSGNTASYYLQDGTAGINIFATFGSTFRPAQGDVVTFVGVTSSFSSGLELYADTTDLPYTYYTDLSNNIAALPAPLVIPFTFTNNNFSNVNYTLAGKYVQFTNVFFGTNAGNVLVAPASGGYFITVTNDQGQSALLSFSGQDMDTQSNTFPAYATSVTGVLFGSMNPVANVASPNFSIMVTKWADIVLPPPAPIPLSAGFSGGNITFNWTDPSFSLQTATNLLGPWSTIPGAADGFMTNVTTDPMWFFRLYHP
jgi:hypothetical protein